MHDQLLAPCPDSPNCVSSDANDRAHAIAPFVLASRSDEHWNEIRALVLSLPRSKLIAEDPRYLRLEYRSALLGFVDDLELQLRREKGEIAVRSASRAGYYDFGVNRRRVEKLRSLLRERGLLATGSS